MPESIVCLLIFQNLFNPFSPYITLALNASVALVLLQLSRFRYRQTDGLIVWTSLVVLSWLLLVIAYRSDGEVQVALKYLRSTMAIGLFAVILGCATLPARSLVKAVNFALAFHVGLVLLQILFSGITDISAPIFGFERDVTVLEQYTLRKLGASSSYDTASLFSVAALLFFYLQYVGGHGRRFALLAVLAFGASLMSSRTGMAMSFCVVTVIGLRALLQAPPLLKLLALGGVVAFLVSFYVLAYPLLLHTLGIAELDSDEVGIVFAAADYGTTGTLEALTSDHLAPLDRPLMDLILGYAADPNTLGRFTDIGYVKFIYHVGIVGTLLLLALHLYMLIRTRKFSNELSTSGERRLIANFLFLLLAIAILFNYKSLELYSRGTGDFIFFLYLFLASRANREISSLPADRRSR